jgi:NADPH:quinone reductase-like Zn-dependent oxidoreductase
VLGRVVGGFVRRRLGQPVIFFVAGGPYQDQLATLRDLIEAGKVRPIIDRTYPLEKTADAIRYVAKENVPGKVAITITPAPARPQESGAT